MTSSLVASFCTVSDAEKALLELRHLGVKSSEMSLVAVEGSTDPYGIYAWESGMYEKDDDWVAEEEMVSEIRRQSLIDAGLGALKGCVIGLTIGLIAGLVSLYSPGLGLITDGDAVSSALSGMAAITAAGIGVGGILGYFADQTLVEDDLPFGGQGMSDGEAVVWVNLSKDANRAEFETILSEHNASSVNLVSAAYLS